MSRQTATPGSGYRHNQKPRLQQIDLFGSGLLHKRHRRAGMVGAAGGSTGGLTSLMTQLILDDAAATATPRKGGRS
jgi:hypothetical protein